MSTILGTAGHIDHGKTSLVRALTGIDCDRLEEEKKRGITIELGFAFCDLPGGERLGIVDMPGHERFVKNMVAGAAGIDFVMLVIAADEGVMPQTREHLEICSLLGIRHGFVALTKKDMVDAEWLEMVTEDIRTFLQGSFLENSPIIPVSSVTGEGLDALKAQLAACAAATRARPSCRIFRLPVDRVFTLKGHGTVVTGTLISGEVRAGDDVVFIPPGLPSKVRSLQSHGTPTDHVGRGQRCAVNVLGVEVDDIERGFTLAHPGTLFPATRWFVNLRCLASAPRALRNRTEIHFHHGARECPARIFLPDRDKLEPGDCAIAELRLSEPLAGVYGDHCVIRAYSPLRTVAGGTLVYPAELPLHKKDPLYQEKLNRLQSLAQSDSGSTSSRDDGTPAAESGSASPKAKKSPAGSGDSPSGAVSAGGEGTAASAHAHTGRSGSTSSDGTLSPKEAENRLQLILDLRGENGASFALLTVLSNLDARLLEKTLQQLSSRSKALCFDKEARLWISEAAFARLTAAVLAQAAEFHRKEPLRPGMARPALLTGRAKTCPPKLAHMVIERALKSGQLVAEGDILRLASHSVTLANDQQGLKKALLKAHTDAGMTPPNLKDVLEELHVSLKEAAPVLNLLCAGKELVKIKDGLYYAAPVMDSILEKVRQWFTNHNDLDLAGLKELLAGLSRKYLVAIMEFMDKEKITVRVGDSRQYRGTNPGRQP